MERIEEMTWRSDTGGGSLADACAGYFGSSPESGEHIRAWRRLLDVAGEPRSDRSVLRWRLTVLRREHERRGGFVHPGHARHA
jgi:hypothetical protein